jgi:hypothetical protein
LHLRGNNVPSATFAIRVELVASSPQSTAVAVAKTCHCLPSSISDSFGTGGTESLAAMGGPQAVIMINGYHGTPFIIIRPSHFPDVISGRLIHVKLVQQSLKSSWHLSSFSIGADDLIITELGLLLFQVIISVFFISRAFLQ